MTSTLMESVTTLLPQAGEAISQVSFSWYDYILFCVMLSLSAFIGIYFGCFGTKQSSANEYLMGDKKMKVFPISVSLIASHVSGITLLAIPADIYRYGASFWLIVPALVVISACTIFVYLPVFHKLQVTSTYEYLERRFDSTNRVFASFLFTLGLFLYLPIIIYLPALAFSTATGLNIHYITPVVCGVCIFYTTLGGLKAVVWTDTLQFTITTGALFVVTVIGIRSAGGVGAIWNKALEGDRLDIFDFDPDPTKRDTFWIVIVGTSVYWLSMAGIHQSCVQKYLSVPTLNQSRLTVVYFAVGLMIVTSCSVFIGLTMYARYADCDPFTTGAVKKNDQLLPYFIMDVASHIPGLSGLFIAGIFCAALSTSSAFLNCVAGTLYEDFVLKVTGPIDDDKRAAYILKFLVCIVGVLCTLLVFIVERLGGILPLAVSLSGVTAGPLLGMFTLGILFPKATSKGVLYGSIIGMLFSSWIILMTQYYKAQGILVDVARPTSVQGCLVNRTTPAPLMTTITSITNITYSHEFGQEDFEEPEKYTPFILFRISFYYYTPVAFLVTIVAGLLISYTLGSDDPPVHRDLLSPVIHFMLSDDHQEQKTKEYYSVDKALHLVTTNMEKDDCDKIKT
ncbi:sodium-coupled monocarboxylate transporter 1-like [Tenebrio molitor]|uniref:sodium-coupled monocarboxylate transporter 1-like n=1 Tax=Tenebrio molitor TaxID=7067 RepID=UPI00362481F5